jgi:hypothetical protein
LAAAKDAWGVVHHRRTRGVEAILDGIHGGEWSRSRRGYLGEGKLGPAAITGAWCCFVVAEKVRATNGLVLGEMKRCRGARRQGPGVLLSQPTRRPYRGNGRAGAAESLFGVQGRCICPTGVVQDGVWVWVKVGAVVGLRGGRRSRAGLVLHKEKSNSSEAAPYYDCSGLEHWV